MLKKTKQSNDGFLLISQLLWKHINKIVGTNASGHKSADWTKCVNNFEVEENAVYVKSRDNPETVFITAINTE